jgi:hypothetical protein
VLYSRSKATWGHEDTCVSSMTKVLILVKMAIGHVSRMVLLRGLSVVEERRKQKSRTTANGHSLFSVRKSADLSIIM